MPGTTIGTSLNLGFPGKLSRDADAIITSRPVLSVPNGSLVETAQSINFGDPVVLNPNNTYSRFGDTATGVASPIGNNFAGIASGEVKQMMSFNLGSMTSPGAYLPNELCPVIETGTTAVVCTEGTPTAGGSVYIVTAAGSVSPIGSFVATSTPANGTAILISCAKWTTGKLDANNVAEITLLTRNRP